ncbi:hypothetical protein LTR66_002361 [Elasticomyces elasticus]|nr:hypothetical protein LTR66_002361 [Elasticomyces elasticus]
MAAAGALQALLRFLSQDARVPLAAAIEKSRHLQKAGLVSPLDISKSNLESLKSIFPDERLAKQVLSAAKRVLKRHPTDSPSSSAKKRKASLMGDESSTSPAALEASLALPEGATDEENIVNTVLLTNRAPLLLAFAVALLKYTMPDQPLSSRLSLAQAAISVNSRSKAVSLGLEHGKSAEEEGWGQGQPTVKIMGREIRVLKRWGYEWVERPIGSAKHVKLEHVEDTPVIPQAEVAQENVPPALWALDLEALKKGKGSLKAGMQSGANSDLPIYTAQSARAYLLKSFDSAPATDPTPSVSPKKRPNSSTKVAEKERNLGSLLCALDLLFESWAIVLDAQELDKRAWSWYVRVRPDVEHGVAGWGGKGNVKLGDILALRRKG